jgi:hypothetical protein
MSRRAIVSVLLLLATACVEDLTTSSGPVSLASITSKVSGFPYSAPVGASLPLVFVLTANYTDYTSGPAAGRSITFFASDSGTINGQRSVTLTTGSDGSVAVTWVLGNKVGPQVLQGTCSGAVVNGLPTVLYPIYLTVQALDPGIDTTAGSGRES